MRWRGTAVLVGTLICLMSIGAAAQTARTINELLREAADSGTAVLFATHDESTVEFADRVVRIDDGVLSPYAAAAAAEPH